MKMATFIFILLSLIGLIDAAYLWRKSKQPGSLICPLGSDCNVILNSRWATLFGVRNEVLGALFYAGMLLLALGLFSLLAQGELLMLLVRIGVSVGFLTSVFLVSVQVRMGNYCLYCLISAAVSTLLFIVSFWL